MGNPRKSLNVYVFWTDVLRLLGVTVRSPELPKHVRCPVCQQGILEIQEDPVCGGAWHSCRGCGTNGDMVELAAKTWNLSISATVARLRRNGLPLPADTDAVRLYQEQQIDYRKRLLRLWDDARSGVPLTPTLVRLVNRFNWHCQVSPERRRKGPALLFGAIDKTTVERVFAPGAMQHADQRNQRGNPSANSVFQGPGWDDVLVLPFWDMPGRICAYLFIGRDGDPEKDFVFKRANYQPPGNGHSVEPFEAGLAAMLSDVLDIADDWDRTVFAVRDPVLALQLQMRNFEGNLAPLPLVIWHEGTVSGKQQNGQRKVRTVHAWQMLGNRTPVFWMPHFDVATILQAARMDGMIATVGPRRSSEENLKEFCWKFTPLNLFRHIQQSAKPWHKVLSGQLHRMTDSAVETFFLGLEADGEDHERILRRCGPTTRNRVATILSQSRGERTVTYSGQTVTERHDGWYVTGRRYVRPELIADAVLRIDHVVYARNSDQVYYGGRVIREGRKISFCVPVNVIEHDTYAWMNHQLISKGKTTLIGNPAWSSKLIEVALRFQRPEVIHGVDTVGWDPQQARFTLPNFTIDLGGRVEPIKAPIFPDDVPAKRLRPPEVLTPEEVERPGRDEAYAGQLFWATVACIVVNILAPARNWYRSGIGLRGTGAEAVGQAVAKAMGCRVITANDAQTVRLALEEEQVHGWPVIVCTGPHLQQKTRKLLMGVEDEQRNIVLALNWWEARVKAIQGGWHILFGEPPAVPSKDMLDFARMLVPAYLQDICERGLNLGEWDDPLDSPVQVVLRDLAGFVDRCGGDPQPVKAAKEVLLADRDVGHAAAFADLLGRFLEEGTLTIVQDGFSDSTPSLVSLPDVDGLLVTHDVLAKLLRGKRVAAPHRSAVTCALVHAGVLIEDREDGWVIEEGWFRKHVRHAHVQRSGLLRVRA